MRKKKIPSLQMIYLLFEIIYIYFGLKFFQPILKNLAPSINYPLLSFSKRNLIDEAIAYLNLPTWSRNYKPCSSRKSEVNCEQIIIAYTTIKEWISIGTNRPEYAAVHIRPKAGIGNGLYHIISGLVVAISLNRSGQIASEIDGLKYNPLLNVSQELNCKQYQHWPIMNQEYWQRNDYKSLKEAQAHFTVRYCFPYFLLTEPGISNYVYEHFGIHFVYFTGNFAIQFSQKVSEYVDRLLSTIPSNVKIIGLHLRTHKKKNKNYIYSEKQVEDVIIPFLNQILDRKNYVALATDWSIYVDSFKKIYENRLILADVLREPDGDFFGAAIDVRLLMACNKMIGSYRSSFSSIAGMLALHKVYFVSMNYPNVFQFTNSQAGITSGIYEYLPDFSYFVNQRLKLYHSIEPALRTFFRNIVI